ncbi:hypothetical protein XENOCAPTIV_027915, partial [Xenoophorus captivus]
VPLERGNSEVYRQREARAARLASEIESSPQYRHRVGLENDEGKSEEEKYSSVVRDGSDREKGRESPRDRGSEKGRDSPGASSREGKYIPLPQRQREMNRERAERGPGGPPPHSRLGGGYRSNPSSSLSSPRPPLPSAAGPQPGVAPSERSSPLSSRGGAYTPHHPQGSPSPGSAQDTPYLDTSSVSLSAQKTSGPAPLFPVDGNVSHPASQPQHSPSLSEEPTKDTTSPLGTAAATTAAPIPDRQSPATPQPARTPGAEDVRSESAERTDGVAELRQCTSTPCPQLTKENTPGAKGGARMIGQGSGPHPQALGPPGGPQFSAQGDGPQGPQQGIYGHTSPQGSYPIQGYSIHSHQGLSPAYPLGQLAQVRLYSSALKKFPFTLFDVEAREVS